MSNASVKLALFDKESLEFDRFIGIDTVFKDALLLPLPLPLAFPLPLLSSFGLFVATGDKFSSPVLLDLIDIKLPLEFLRFL